MIRHENGNLADKAHQYVARSGEGENGTNIVFLGHFGKLGQHLKIVSVSSRRLINGVPNLRKLRERQHAKAFNAHHNLLYLLLTFAKLAATREVGTKERHDTVHNLGNS